MKKITIIFAALAISASVFASNPFPISKEAVFSALEKSRTTGLNVEKLNKKVSTAFLTKFKRAEKVNWKQVSDLYFAHFEINSKEFAAAYSEDGEMIAMSRHVPTDQLPYAVTNILEEQYAGYKLPENVTEVVMDGATNYYLTVEGATRLLQLKCSADGSVSVQKKIKKRILVGSVS